MLRAHRQRALRGVAAARDKRRPHLEAVDCVGDVGQHVCVGYGGVEAFAHVGVGRGEVGGQGVAVDGHILNHFAGGGVEIRARDLRQNNKTEN